MGCIDRFKERTNVSPVVEVAFPSQKNPEIIFKIRRMAEAEKRGPQWDAMLKSRLPEDRQTEKNAVDVEVFSRHYTEQIFKKLQIESFVHQPKAGEPVEFSKEVLQGLLDEMDMNEIQLLVIGYVNACREDEQAKKKKDRSAGNSAISSKNGLDTRSLTPA